MKIGHINIRSILSGFNEFRNLILEQDFDVIAVTETWLSDAVDSDVVEIPGYQFLRKDRKGRGGGVGAYVRNSFHYQVVNVDSPVSENLEYLLFQIKIQSKKIIIGTFYRPPNTNLSSCIDDFDNILSTICPMSDELFCMGDFNVNFFNLNNPLNNCFGSYGLTQIVSEPTRITGTTSTLIDLIFTTNLEAIQDVGTLSTDNFSDHRLVFTNLKIITSKMSPKKISYRCFRNFDLDLFLMDLCGLPWSDLVREGDLDYKILIFNKFILDTFDKHAPIIEKRVTKPPAPWLTENLRLIMKERDRSLRKFKRTRLDADWKVYKDLRNYTVMMVRNERRGYLKSINSLNNPKKTWSALKSLNIHSGNKSANLPDYLRNPEDINNYFSTFFQCDDENCFNKIKFYKENKINSDNNFTFALTTVHEVNIILNSIRSNAVGTDQISIHMLKLCSPFIDKYIVHIINSCIERGYFPSAWKSSIGVPLPKVSSPKHFSDLRVISILPTVSKIFEKILHKQLSNYCENIKIIPSVQCGFRSGHSTTTALALVLNDIIRAIDDNKVSILVLLDYSKAFDTVSHKLLCAKLEYYGVGGSSLLLLQSFLSNRTQMVQADHIYSTPADILSGVPQGSILSPLLFIIYTADILRSLEYCKVQAYADDTQIYTHFDINDLTETSIQINKDLQKIKLLSNEHNLKLNSHKSQLMCFGKTDQKLLLKQDINIKIDNCKLQFVESARNLGVIVDTDLRFVEHLKVVFGRAYSNLKLIYHNRHILDIGTKKTLCESLVMSHFNYCDFVYGPCLYQTDKYRIQKVQNSCFRLIYGIRKYESISYKIKESNSLNMENRRQLHLLNFVHKCLTLPNTSTLLKGLFVPHANIHSRKTRFNNKFVLPRHRTAMFSKCFTYQAITKYNKLPDLFKQYNINKFKFKLKLLLMDKQ